MSLSVASGDLPGLVVSWLVTPGQADHTLPVISQLSSAQGKVSF